MSDAAIQVLTPFLVVSLCWLTVHLATAPARRREARRAARERAYAAAYAIRRLEDELLIGPFPDHPTGCAECDREMREAKP